MPIPSEQSNVVPYLRALWARRWLVVAVTALFAVVSLGYSALAPKSYTATAKLLLEAPLPTALLTANGSTAYQSPVNSVDAAQVVESGAVAQLVAEQLGRSPGVSAVSVGTSDVLDISSSSSDAKLAQRAANAYAQAYISYERQQTNAALVHASTVLQKELSSVEAAVASFGAEIAGSNGNAGLQTEAATAQAALQAEETGLKNQIATYQTLASAPAGEIGQVITTAALPTSPSSPRIARNVVFALIAGVVVGMLAALALQYRDDVAARQRGPHLANGSVPGPVRTVVGVEPAGTTGAAGGWSDAPTGPAWPRTSKGGIR